MNESPAGPAEPLPSATVVLVRDGARAAEVLLVLRHARTAFGASYVFPGGLLEPGDRDAHQFCAGERAARADRCLNLSCDGLDYYSAAIRELFEESGVLLARTVEGDWALNDATAATYETIRRALNAGEMSWPEVLRTQRLALACDCLHYVAHWITPVRRKKRFTTRFFVARLPGAQRAQHDGGELTDSCWMSVERALAAAHGGELLLPPPTRVTLEDLAAFDSVENILEWAAGREARGVEPVMPAIVGPRGEERVLMPGDAGYPAARGAGES